VNEHTAIVLQARMGSSRLPGKVLAAINGKPVLAHCVERPRASSLRVIVATTTGSEDDAGAETAARLGAPVLRGPSDDVLGRYAMAVEQFGLVEVVRATADNPAVDIDAPARCLALLREDGADRANGVTIPNGSAIALLITLELPPEVDATRAFDEIGRAREAGAPDTALVRFCRALDEAGVLDHVEIAVPRDVARQHQLLALREAVPAGVNARVGRAKQRDARIAKTAADMIVPFDRLAELLAIYDEEFRARHLDAAVWGHISDGNLHPNVIPRSFDECESGKAAILRFGREVIRLGGSPLAEHGVGRSPIKQQLLIDLYGRDGVAEMRAVKRTLDPDFKLAPGVLFTET